jgi:hypothetical protein
VEGYNRWMDTTPSHGRCGGFWNGVRGRERNKLFYAPHVRSGCWLCENAAARRADRMDLPSDRELLMPPIIPVDAIKAISPNAAEPQTTNLCPCCGGRMVIIERFERGATPHYRASPPTPAIRIDTS